MGKRTKIESTRMTRSTLIIPEGFLRNSEGVCVVLMGSDHISVRKHHVFRFVMENAEKRTGGYLSKHPPVI
jgi:hypothetical protein